MTTYLGLLQEKIAILDVTYKNLDPSILTLKLPYRLAQRLQRGSTHLNPEDVLLSPGRYSLNDAHVQILRVHLLVNEALDLVQELQSLILLKYTQERDKQERKRHERMSSTEKEESNCSSAMIERNANLEGLERGKPLSWEMSLFYFRG